MKNEKQLQSFAFSGADVGRGMLFAGLALVALQSFSHPAIAQDEGSMKLGTATVSVGTGVSILTLPDVSSTIINYNSAIPALLSKPKYSEDFDQEIGWSINGSVDVPLSAGQSVSLNGFWVNISDTDSQECLGGTAVGVNRVCLLAPLVDVTGVNQITSVVGPHLLTTDTKRDVDQWGLSLESKWQFFPGVMSETVMPKNTYFSLGADIRGIDQSLEVSGQVQSGAYSYSEDLDTRYYGAYAALGGGYTPLLFAQLWQSWGLQSSFRLQGGVYYAKTDFGGFLDTGGDGIADPTGGLSLSHNKTAFIGGLTLETKKRIGRRSILSLKSDYEYYSYVPTMTYNRYDDVSVTNSAYTHAGTSIDDDDAFSARTMLRLTIGLGPDDLYN